MYGAGRETLSYKIIKKKKKYGEGCSGNSLSLNLACWVSGCSSCAAPLHSKAFSQLPAFPSRSSHTPPTFIPVPNSCRAGVAAGPGHPLPGLCSSLGLRRSQGPSGSLPGVRRREGGRRDRRGGEGRRMLRGWLVAFSPARSSQGFAWRMSHPLSTGNSGTPITPT